MAELMSIEFTLAGAAEPPADLKLREIKLLMKVTHLPYDVTRTMLRPGVRKK